MLFRAYELRCAPRVRPFPSPAVGQKLKAAAERFLDWIESCADHYASGRMYETLSRLSDAELAHRGLRRETLAQDLICRTTNASSRKPEGRR